jgi:hypothetical protein
MAVKVYSVYGLISEYQRMHPNGHFFDRDTLKFFGETVSSMRLLKGTVNLLYSQQLAKETPNGAASCVPSFRCGNTGTCCEVRRGENGSKGAS